MVFHQLPDFGQAVSLGTTIMAVKFKDGVILAADSRTSSGSYIVNRVADKLTELYPDSIYCCRSGSAADTQAIADIIRYYLQVHAAEHDAPPPVEIAANLFHKVCYSNRGMLSAGLIVAGWDKASGGAVYNIPQGGSVHQLDISIGGSGSIFIYGYCDEFYRPDMSKEECLDFCRKAVALAISRDGSSGGVIRTCVITEAGAERDVIPFYEVKIGPPMGAPGAAPAAAEAAPMQTDVEVHSDN
ncbi:20S proteasome subunit beta 1 [Fonticula alba]|uniref:proteasome endopeptidase complex n=1 Tax=Fonticula alba TaxID=691883 RepID=A0A058Z5M1_FONAL|nr:20S proteasome subunit beta 1 [Fonticula alba]KCV69574.1 20S proteasome subunit beta 1 [Fonticula alba]|eukprot:XP_009496139.1 20S proteasome subunit beta 1 [Fonticula alba]